MTTKIKNIRISINRLVLACRVLGEVKVVAAGELYATLEADLEMRRKLSKNLIAWDFD